MGERPVQRPDYDTGQIRAGIAHFGIGNFHRSHQAMYLDRLMNQGDHSEWGIVGIGVMPGDARMRDALAEQNYRYTLVERYGDGTVTAREIGSIRGMLLVHEDADGVMNLLTDPAIRIVSLTITEGGYNIDGSTGEFDLQNPNIQMDLANTETPRTVFGLICEALRLRRLQRTTPFTVISCDNLQGNGEVVKLAILSYASAMDRELASWIAENVSFPNSMVDRITPVTSDADREMVLQTFGVKDAWPVMTEPFTQWVLEDNFVNGRPDWQRVGVQITDDVVPYELMKLRLLNATHQAMAYIGMLKGYTYVHEAVADSEINQFLRDYFAEARETLHPVPGIDTDTYIETLFERYENAHIADTLARLAVDASDRIPKFVLPSILDNLAAGRSIETATRVITHWSKYLTAAKDIVDPLGETLKSLASSKDDLAFVRYEPVFGDLSYSDEFQTAYLRELSLM